ncbi:MAG: LamG domain-containing protein, partial [Bacteroidota bacterium]
MMFPTVLLLAQPGTPSVSSGGGLPDNLCAGESRILTASATGNTRRSYNMLTFPLETRVGTSTPYVKIPVINWAGVNNFTFETWVYPDMADNFYNRVFTFGTLQMRIYGGGTQTLYMDNLNGLQSTTIIPMGKWLHVAVTMDGVNAKLYLNGVLNATIATGNTMASLGGDGSWSVLGRSTNGDQPGSFKGFLDETRLWKTTRTASEISSNYQKSVDSTDANLMVYYRYDQANTDGVVRDASANARHGQMLQFPSGNNAQFVSSTATGGTGLSSANTYTWSGPSGTLSSTSGATVTATPTVTSTYTVTAKDGAGQSALATGSKTLTVGAGTLPTISPASVTTCANYATLTASGNGPWIWAHGPTTKSVVVTTSGTYYVSNGSCYSAGAVVSFTAPTIASPTITSSA